MCFRCLFATGFDSLRFLLINLNIAATLVFSQTLHLLIRFSSGLSRVHLLGLLEGPLRVLVLATVLLSVS